VPLENGGGEGSEGGHLEKLIFGDETMVSDDTVDAKFSSILLAIAEDSGWYEVDYDMGEHYFWGKGEGCDHFKTTCPHADVTEYCSQDNINKCSDNMMYKTLCQTSTFIGSTCPINLQEINCKREIQNSSNSYFYRGQDSLCHIVEVVLLL
jgi:hypothetical protein